MVTITHPATASAVGDAALGVPRMRTKAREQDKGTVPPKVSQKGTVPLDRPQSVSPEEPSEITEKSLF